MAQIQQIAFLPPPRLTGDVQLDGPAIIEFLWDFYNASAAIAVGTSSGTYTPTLSGVANIEASLAYECQYMRVGATVTVSGKIDVDPIAAAATKLGISLPIDSAFVTDEDCAGVAFASGIAGQGAAIFADTTNNRAEMNWVAVDITYQPMYFSFTYQIL